MDRPRLGPDRHENGQSQIFSLSLNLRLPISKNFLKSLNTLMVSLVRTKAFLARLLPLLAVIALVPPNASAAAPPGKARFQWDPVDHPSVAGYTVHWGTASGSYTRSMDVGMTTEVVLEEFDANVEYYAAITAHTATGEHSPYSVESSFKLVGGMEGEAPAFRIGTLHVEHGSSSLTSSSPSGSSIRFSVSGGSGNEIRVFASSNLHSWEHIATSPFTSGEFTITDPGAVRAAKRFYRLEVH